MSDNGLDSLFGELGRKTIIVPAKYCHLYLRAVIARDQLGLNEDLTTPDSENYRRLLKRTDGRYVVSWDGLIYWSDELALLRNMLRPEIVFSTTIPPDVVVISEKPWPPQNIIPWKGTWDTIADKLPRHEHKDGPS
jgi:hypothetical protein